MKEKEVYKQKIIEMVQGINNSDYLQMIYSFIISYINEKEKTEA